MSSGSIIHVALKKAKELGKGNAIVVIFPALAKDTSPHLDTQNNYGECSQKCLYV
jgi:hypothetical protein